MRRLALLLAVLGTLALPAAAGAMIQLQRGIAGAALGNTQAQVRAALGAPARVRVESTGFGRLTTWRYRGGVDVSFLAGTHVTAVSTTGRADRTPGGAGVGATERGLKRAIGGLRCENQAAGRLRTCQLGRTRPGRRVTTFRLRHDRVFEVDIGFVLD